MQNRILLIVLALLLSLPVVAEAKEESTLALSLARARLALDTGDTQAALTQIETLKASHPNNVQVLTLEAEAYRQSGDPYQAQMVLEQAQALDPKNEDIAEALRSAREGAGSFVALDGSIRDTSGQSFERLQQLAGQKRVMPQISLGAVVDNDFITTVPLLTSNGATKTYDESQQRLEAYMLIDRPHGSQGKLSFFGTTAGVAGAGGQYKLADGSGETLFEGNYQRPNWEDFIVSIIDEGARDNAKVSRSQRLDRLTHGLSANAGVGYNHYTLRHDDDAASTVGFNGGLSYEVNPADLARVVSKNTTLSLNYELDAEYSLYRNVEHTPLNPHFSALGFTNRQLHEFTVDIGKELGRGFAVNGYGGYIVDAEGGDAPQGGASLSYQASEALALELRGSRGIMPEQNQQTVDQLGLNVKYKLQ